MRISWIVALFLALVLASDYADAGCFGLDCVFSPTSASSNEPTQASTSATSVQSTSVTTISTMTTTTTASTTIATTTTTATAVTTSGAPRTKSTTTAAVTSLLTSTTATSSTTALPTQTSAESSGGGDKLYTAGIVVGSVVVAAAIGIWVFRKWKLSPSRDFQTKIRGDDFTDYPRTYESDTVHLRQLGDSPAEPAPIKSPYTAQTAFPSPMDDQYYDPNYASKDQGGYGQGGYVHQDYGRAVATPGYDQGYDHGYNDHNGYGHGEYAPSQVGGGYGHGDYAPSQIGGYNQGGYAHSNVGGGYQHESSAGSGDQDLTLTLLFGMSFLSRFSRTQLIIGGLLTYATGVSAALTFLPSSSASSTASDPDNANRFPTESARRSTFDSLASGYDKEVGLHEYLLGIQRRRKRLLKQAKGRVLEIASGTGRNVDYYTKGCCDEIVFTDFSEGMMEVLKKTVAESDLGKRYDYQLRRQQQLELERIAHPRDQQNRSSAESSSSIATSSSAMPTGAGVASSVVETEIRFKVMNAAAIPYPDGSFDTVVDTFGLCSFEDPVQVLREMKRVLRPGGKLLLLEHGNSHWTFMKNMQAKQLDRHVHKYGCYWNREIEELVQEAGLKIVEEERSQLGTVYYMVAE
ncbi:Methyltransferase-like protein 7B [Mortierella claussenii]|nr:Methyltransferase-like protein 7B [Mortierella claussenii]